MKCIASGLLTGAKISYHKSVSIRIMVDFFNLKKKKMNKKVKAVVTLNARKCKYTGHIQC